MKSTGWRVPLKYSNEILDQRPVLGKISNRSGLNKHNANCRGNKMMNRQQHIVTIAALGLALGINSAFTAPVRGPAARINVTARLEKDRDSQKSKSKKSTTNTKQSAATYHLDIQVSNSSKPNASFDLEWYFLKRPIDKKGNKGDPVLCEKGKTTLEIGGQKRVMHKVVSATLTTTETKTSSKKKKGSSTKKSAAGDVYAGYVVLVRHEGKILAKDSNENRFTSPDWLAKLDGPVQKRSGRKAASSGGKKKKRGKKNK